MTALRHVADIAGRDAGTTAPAGDDAQGAARAELAGYVAQMTGQMAAMARGEKLDLLAYFLDMARIEAATQAEMRRAA